MRYILCLALAISGSSLPAWAYLEEMKLPEKVAASTWIAKIHVRSVRPLPFSNENSRQTALLRYQDVAQVQVLELVKGSNIPRQIEIEYNTGASCPNVRYVAGEDCLVFLERTKSGRFSTVNYYNGRHSIQGNVFKVWQGRDRVPVVEGMAQIRKLVLQSRQLPRKR
jgi:hypothetical protein